LLNSYPAITAMGPSLRVLKLNQVSVDGIYENIIIDMKKKFSIGKVNRMMSTHCSKKKKKKKKKKRRKRERDDRARVTTIVNTGASQLGGACAKVV
jgi:hypothetical protein